MATLIFIAIVLWFLTENYPGTFGFIGTFFSAIWNFIGSIVMFFVGLLGKFLSVFGFIGDGLGWLMGKLGILLAPVLNALPDSPLIPLAGLLLLGLLFWLLRHPEEISDPVSLDHYLKLTYAWCFAAFNLGMVIAGSGNPLIWRSGALDTYVTDFPMTLLNYAEWSGFAQTMLSLTLIGGLIVSLIFAVNKGLRSFLRTWVGLALCGTLGYGYMNVRLVFTDWLADNLGFIGSLLNIPIGFAEFIILIQFFFGIVVFLLPMGAITALNEMNRAKEQWTGRETTRSENPFDDIDDSSSDPIPAYVTDDDGNNYSVSIDGDFLYINLPGGRISTKWEYVKGQPYFDLNGKRFHLHS